MAWYKKNPNDSASFMANQMAQGPFRVRRAGASAPFEEVGLVGGSAESIERAIGFIVRLAPGNFVLQRVTEIGPPVQHGIVIAGFYDGLSGPHEAFPASGEEITEAIVGAFRNPVKAASLRLFISCRRWDRRTPREQRTPDPSVIYEQ